MTRDFLDRVVTSVTVPEGDGRWIEYAGGYTRHAGRSAARISRAKAPNMTTVEEEGNQGLRRLSGAQARLNFNEKHGLERCEDDGKAAGRDCNTAKAA